jgi:hypothetical protein
MEYSEIKKHMLTSGKLIKWLQQFPEDTLIYALEFNTGDLQELPDIESPDGNNIICNVKKDKEYTLNYLKNWYKNDQSKIDIEFDHIYKYIHNDDGIIIRL